MCEFLAVVCHELEWTKLLLDLQDRSTGKIAIDGAAEMLIAHPNGHFVALNFLPSDMASDHRLHFYDSPHRLRIGPYLRKVIRPRHDFQIQIVLFILTATTTVKINLAWSIFAALTITHVFIFSNYIENL